MGRKVSLQPPASLSNLPLLSPLFRPLVLKPQPYPYGLIEAGRGEVCAIGRPRHTPHRIGMPAVGESCLPTSGIPHPYGLIEAGRGEALAIGRPRHAVYLISMAGVGESRLPAASIPHPRGHICTGRGDALAIGRPRHT